MANGEWHSDELSHSLQGSGNSISETLGDKLKRIAKQNIVMILTVAAVVLGICIGFGVRHANLSQTQIIHFGFPGELLIHMLKLIIIPLVVCSIVSGAASIDPKALGKLGGWALIFFLVTTLISSAIGLTFVVIIHPGSLERIKISNILDQEVPESKEIVDSFLDILRNLFPSNLVSAAFQSYSTSYRLVNITKDANTTLIKVPFGTNVDGMNILGLIMFAIAAGVAIRKLGEEGEALIRLFNAGNELTMELVSWIMWYAPLGIMFLVAAKIAEMEDIGFLFASLGKYVACCVISLSLHGLLILPFIYFVITRKNPYTYLKGMITALATAFGTASSAATLPLTIKCVEENNGVSTRISRFILPIGTTVNMDGAACYQCVAAVFIAQINNISLTFAQIIIIMVTATASSVGAAGIPAGGVLTMAIILEAVGLPTRDLSLILAIDWFVDRICTVINVEGNAFGAGILQHFVDHKSKTEKIELKQVVQEPELPENPEENAMN